MSMKSTPELLRTLRTICEDVLGKQDVMAAWLNVHRTTLVRKLHGQIPFTYEEIVTISERLHLPDLVASGRGAHKVTDVAGQRFLDLLRRLSPSDRRRVHVAIALLLEGVVRHHDGATIVLFEEYKHLTSHVPPD